MDKHRDHLRDALILDTKKVLAIYRFSGEDITNWFPDALRFILSHHGRFFPDCETCLRDSSVRKAISKTRVCETPTGIAEIGEYAKKGEFEDVFGEEETCEFELDDETGRMRLQHRVKHVHSMEFVPSEISTVTRNLHFLAPHSTKLIALVAFARHRGSTEFSALLAASRKIV